MNRCPHCYDEINIYKEYDADDLPWNDMEDVKFKCPHCDKDIVIWAHNSITHSIEEVEE